MIEGCANGLVALYTKIHHCTIDGVSGAELMQALLDRSPTGDVVPPAESAKPEAVPGSLEMLGAACSASRASPTASRAPPSAPCATSAGRRARSAPWRAASVSTACR